MEPNVIVVGSGVVGLTTAVVLAERGHRVAVWAGEPARETTSAVAGGLWWPYRVGPAERAGDWSLTSLTEYGHLATRPEETGVRFAEGVHSGVRREELGAWASEVPGLRPSTEAEYAAGQGVWGRLPLIDMPVHLAWLAERFAAAGGEIHARRVSRLADVPAPVVVNCSGLGARGLVPDDGVRPVRGQLVVVENPGVTTWFTGVDATSSDTTYFIPQPHGLLLGGTAQEDDWDMEPDPGTAREIVARCARLRPEIARARVLAHRVGLRPARDGGVRLTAETLPGGARLVHNYGHGGAGVTVAWGCAGEAAELAEAAGPA
ncbi:FAD-dependent oxidoreductase [Streptomyces tsukubensis]|uniref:D-amino-acid oxidase n=1 Tax=Streptomyces tsukubensis TaxID=83656 RepID=A0A1V4AEA8_9ACTN|nr:FAD-dependent oxidoreductase [Streptomyces tsukubensis]OON81829.1 amino acid oxidase [Streptomyces tsukubensis]QFR96618.1 FAD-dependent oxidoreductase [Streptomyces tsukubensis]